MNIYVKIILVIFAFAYFISPIDIIPDFMIPYLGWVDDTFIIGVVIYMIRYGKLPYFSGKGNKNRLFNFFANLFNSPKGQQQNVRENDKKNNQTKKTPREILGVNRYATKDEIQAAYKIKVKQYHPDKVSHLGEDLQKVANDKFIEIQNAYDTLMK